MPHIRLVTIAADTILRDKGVGESPGQTFVKTRRQYARLRGSATAGQFRLMIVIRQPGGAAASRNPPRSMVRESLYATHSRGTGGLNPTAA